MKNQNEDDRGHESEVDQSTAMAYSKLVFANVVDWYKNADSKAQIILTLDGALVAFLTSSIFKRPAELSDIIRNLTPRTWLLLVAMCACPRSVYYRCTHVLMVPCLSGYQAGQCPWPGNEAHQRRRKGVLAERNAFLQDDLLARPRPLPKAIGDYGRNVPDPSPGESGVPAFKESLSRARTGQRGVRAGWRKSNTLPGERDQLSRSHKLNQEVRRSGAPSGTRKYPTVTRANRRTAIASLDFDSGGSRPRTPSLQTAPLQTGVKFRRTARQTVLWPVTPCRRNEDQHSR